MLSIYRRHIKTCAHRSEGRKYRRCRCPIWADGLIGGQEIRESLRTRNWEEAEEEKLPKLKTKFSPSTEAKAPDPLPSRKRGKSFWLTPGHEISASRLSTSMTCSHAR